MWCFEMMCTILNRMDNVVDSNIYFEYLIHTPWPSATILLLKTPSKRSINYINVYLILKLNSYPSNKEI